MKRLLIGLALLGTARVEAREPGSGAAFLRIDPSARTAAMGGAFTALADDVNAIHYNPGGLAALVRREFGATHAEWLLGTKYDSLGFVQPTRFGALGLGLCRLASGGIEGRAADRSASGGFEASDTAVIVGLGRTAGLFGSGTTGLGGNLKYLESRLGPDKASTLAVDIGATHRLDGRPLSVGAAVLNLGRGMRFVDQTDPLPLTVSVGAALKVGGGLQLALDLRHEPYDRRTDLGLGTEYALLPAVTVRAGYASLTPSGAGGSPLAGLGGGFGIKQRDYRADYTLTPFGALGNAQRLSLGARFR